MFTDVQLNVENYRLYKELPVVRAGYGDPSINFQGTDLIFTAPFIDDKDDLEKVLSVTFYFTTNFIVLNYETFPDIEIPESDKIYVSESFEFKKSKTQYFYFNFSSFESTIIASAESCQVEITKLTESKAP